MTGEDQLRAIHEEGQRISDEQTELMKRFDAVEWEDGQAVKAILLELDRTMDRAAELVNAEMELCAELGIEIPPHRRRAGLNIMATTKAMHDRHVEMVAAIDGGWWPNRHPPAPTAADN